MPDPAHPPVPWDTVMAGLGSMLFFAARIEHEIARALPEQTSAAGAPWGVKANSWKEWQNEICAARPEHAAILEKVVRQIDLARQIRNDLIHGLTGAQADPFGQNGKSGYCINLPERPGFLHFADLEKLLQVMERLTRTIYLLSNAAREKDDTRAHLHYEEIRTTCLPSLPDLTSVVG